MSDHSVEQEARRLHKTIYGPQSDKDWGECRDIWVKNIQWLRDNQHREKEPVVGFFIDLQRPS